MPDRHEHAGPQLFIRGASPGAAPYNPLGSVAVALDAALLARRIREMTTKLARADPFERGVEFEAGPAANNPGP
jgi:hypothetical protein